MSEETVATPADAAPGGRPAALRWVARLRDNPVLVKEMRGRMRGSRAFVLLTIYLVLLSLAVAMVSLAYSTAQVPVGSVESRQLVGKALFGVVAGLEIIIISFTAPALSAGAISSERERQTYDLLRVTLLPARSLVWGKFTSAFGYLLLLLLAALPLQSLAFLYGGVALEEIVVGTLLLVVTAAAFCAVGIFCSSFTHRTLVSTVLAYGFAIFIMFGLPMLAGLGLGLVSNTLSRVSSPVIEATMIRLGWILVSINPLATGVASELILTDSQSLWVFKTQIGANNISLISPWIPFTLAYLLLSAVLLWLSVLLVRRVER